MPPLFSDRMVLQRDQPVPVWGRAKPNESITVEFAGKTASTRAGADGKWLVRLDPLPASREGRDLVVRSSGEKEMLRFADILVGDVWLCSGQSNMHFTMKNVADAASEIPAARNPDIRFFYTEPQFAQSPADSATGEWQPVSPETVSRCSAVAYFFARDLQKQIGVPVGLLLSSVGGTRIETWMPIETLTGLGLGQQLIAKWKNLSADEFAAILAANTEYHRQRWQVYPEQARAARAEGTPVPPEPKPPEQRPHSCPAALHNGMIAPLQPFAIRGVIWYQGESSIGSPYEKLLSALIADWRKVWGSDLPFLFVQLPPHKTITPQFREAQFRVWQSTPHTGMVGTTDVGDAEEIHPPRKQPVGQRLALAARAVAYGEKVEFSGPVFESLKIDGSRAIVSFTHADSGLEARGGVLRGFAIAGADGQFVPADAVIDGGEVIVSSEAVNRPATVRYCWDKVPDGNLYNREGLPAVPFRSDLSVQIRN
jgi:sialate O-acetylesterase